MQTVQSIGTLKFTMEKSGVITTTNMRLLSVSDDNEFYYLLGCFGMVVLFMIIIRWLIF